MSKDTLFSSSFKAGRRTYLFEVKKSSNGFYILISEMQNIKGKERKDRLIIFQEHTEEFLKHLEKSIEELKKVNIYFHD